jgi:hypothetical protein
VSTFWKARRLPWAPQAALLPPGVGCMYPTAFHRSDLCCVSRR